MYDTQVELSGWRNDVYVLWFTRFFVLGNKCYEFALFGYTWKDTKYFITKQSPNTKAHTKGL